VEHATHGALRNATPPEWPGQCQEYEPSWRSRPAPGRTAGPGVHVALGLADDVTRHELRRVLEHVDEAVQLAQDVVGQVLRRARLAVQIDRNLGVLEPNLLDELAQIQHGGIQFRARGELFVVDRQDERAGAALLLGELAQVAVARRPQHLEAFLFDGRGQSPDPRPEVFSDLKSSSMMTMGN